MPADIFTAFAYDLVPNTRSAEVPFVGFEINDVLNRQCSFRGMLPSFHPYATDATLLAGGTSIYIDHGGVLRWGAILWESNFDFGEQDEWLCLGEGHFSYYLDGDNGARRTIDSRQGMTYAISTGAVNGIGVEVTFPNAAQGTPVDMFDVVTDLLAHAANIAGAANVGFTGIRQHGPSGATAHPAASGTKSGVTWARTYWDTERRGVGSAIAEISQSYPGFDWAVSYEWDFSTSPPTPRRYFDLYYPRRGVTRANSGVVLEHGGNVWLVSGTQSARGLAAQMRGLGAGLGSEALVSELDDSTARYPATRSPYLVGKYDAWDEAVQLNLDRRTRSALAVSRNPVPTYTAKVRSDVQLGLSLGSIGTGDTVRLIVDPPSTSFAIDDYFRVVSQRVTVNDVGLTSWELGLVLDAVTTGVF